MSLASTTVFEVRPGAGSATNGGGFVPGSAGTDWSQQNSPQYSVTDSVTAGTTTITSATANFGADVVGNIIYVAGGTGSVAAAWYQIVSRTNSTTIVVDRSTGLTAGTGVTLHIGGALDSPWTIEPSLTAGMTVWIKSGTLTFTATQSLAATGDATNGPITWQGYHTSRGDHDGTRPIFTTSTNSIDLFRSAATTQLYFRIFDNLEVSSTAGTPGNGFTAGTSTGFPRYFVISNCYIHGLLNGIIGDNSAYDFFGTLQVVNCEITACTNDGILNVGGNITVDGCYIHGNSGYGFEWPRVGTNTGNAVYPLMVRSSVFYNNSLGGIYFQSAVGVNGTQGPLLDVNHCAFVSNTNDGIRLAQPNGDLSILALQNSILYGNSGYGVNITNAAATIFFNRNNAYGSNTSGARNNLAAGSGDVTLTADPFTARTSNDFTLNGTAGGGAACKAVGFPGSLPGLVAAGSADVGVLQSPGATTTNIFTRPRIIVVQQRYFQVRNRAAAILAAAPVLNVMRTPPRSVTRQQLVRRLSSTVIPAAPVTVPVIMPPHRRSYPVYVARRRTTPAAFLVAPPVVTILRTPPRMLTRQQPVRKNAGQALFAQTSIAQTVLITSPRKVR